MPVNVMQLVVMQSVLKVIIEVLEHAFLTILLRIDVFVPIEARLLRL